jgi:hypothetical protein
MLFWRGKKKNLPQGVEKYYRRAAFSMLKSRLGNILAKAAALRQGASHHWQGADRIYIDHILVEV